jgi:hypothetical protein
MKRIAAVIKESDELTVRVLNQDQSEFICKIKIEMYKDSGSLIYEEIINDLIKANAIKILGRIPQTAAVPDQDWTIILSMFDQDENLVFRNFYTEERWKYRTLPPADIKKELAGNLIKLSSDKPVFFADVFHPDAEFSDRGFILLPGEEKILKIRSSSAGIDESRIRIFALNNYLKINI